MAWTAKILLDKNKTDTGTVTCVWNEGLADEFRYTERIEIRVASGQALAQNAKDALADKQATDTRVTQLVPIMEGYLNG